MAIMLITHDLGVVAEMADDVAVMYLGRVVEQAPVDAIFHDPQAPLYPGAAALDSPHPVAHARAADADRGRGAAPLQPADRLPVPPALPGVHARRCDRQAPILRPVGDHHAVSCFLYE